MTAALDLAALLVTAAALVAAAVALAATGRPRAALPVLLDLLTAAGLIRLAADPEWRRLLTAAAVVLLRHVIATDLGRSGPPPSRPPAAVEADSR